MFPIAHRIRYARHNEAGELYTLTRAAFVSEAQRFRDPNLPPLAETLDHAQQMVDDPYVIVLVAVASEDGEGGRRGRLIGALRMWPDPDGPGMGMGRMVVAPDLKGRGIGSSLLAAAIEEAQRHEGVTHLTLRAGAVATDVLAIYRRFGFVEVAGDTDERGTRMVVMTRPV